MVRIVVVIHFPRSTDCLDIGHLVVASVSWEALVLTDSFQALVLEVVFPTPPQKALLPVPFERFSRVLIEHELHPLTLELPHFT